VKSFAIDLGSRFRSSSVKRVVGGVGALLCLAVGAGCSMKSMIYPAPAVQVGDPPASFEEVGLRLDDGTGVVGWHRPGSERDDRPVMIFFHGNGENLETMKATDLYERLAALGVPLLVVDYPGYGRSTGQPSEESLKSAATAALKWAGELYPNRAVVPCGWSLGAALAIHLAATRPTEIEGVVAISPWISLPEVAKAHFPGWLVAMGLREEYDSLQAAPRVSSPALVIHGAADSIIPMDQGKSVAESLQSARWVPVEGAGHNDLLSFAVVWREIDSFVTGLRAPAGV